MIEPVSIYDSQALDKLRQEFRIDPQLIRKLRNDLFKRFQPDDLVCDGSTLTGRLALHPLELDRQCDSAIDGATKLLFRTPRGLLIESVILRIATGRTTLCVSSQVGCAAACGFCATGNMGIAQDLSAEEILDQVLQAGQLVAVEGRRIRNIVFMGMGEPFHNEDNLYAALEGLTAAEWFHHSPTKILVSTVGISDAMIRCARRFPEINLALSLHSARQEIRERLIPLATKYPLEDLRRALVEINRLQRCTVMIEYLMLSGINDSSEDAQAFIDWLAGLHVHVNLIPYNPIEDAPELTGTKRAGRDAFANQLKAAGLKTTVRYSLGHDIAAACGQLVKKENRELARTLAILKE